MQTIAIISQKGGAGKTTLAIGLASCAELDGQTALIIDADPQATASQWSDWREGKAPEVIDSTPPRIASKVEQARELGANFVVIDTPPHANNATTSAVDVADVVLIPCRPSGFDLSAIRVTAEHVKLAGKQAYVVFTAGAINAPKTYAEAGELVQGFGLEVCPHTLPDRASHRHSTGAGQTIFEHEPEGKASQEVRAIYEWVCKLANMQTIQQKGRKTA